MAGITAPRTQTGEVETEMGANASPYDLSGVQNLIRRLFSNYQY
jgi:hypothetical protein